MTATLVGDEIALRQDFAGMDTADVAQLVGAETELAAQTHGEHALARQLERRFAALLRQQSQRFCRDLRCLLTAIGVALERWGVLRIDENQRISSAQCLALRASQRGERLMHEHDRR